MKLLQGRAFKLSFLAGILFFILANIYTTIPERGEGEGFCFDCYETFGFPFALHESGTMLHLNQFIWAGVVLDVSIAVIFSLIIGFIVSFVWSKIPRRRIKLN